MIMHTRPYAKQLFVLLASIWTLQVMAQPRTDTSRAMLPTVTTSSRFSTGPKPYKDVITAKAISDPGLFTVHKVEDKYYFEIGDSLLGRDILIVNRISKSAAGFRTFGQGYAGDEIGRNVVRFEKGPNNRLFIRNISYAEYAKDSTSPMFVSLSNSNIQPIAASFDIRAFSRDSAGTVIDITDYISGDNDVLHFNSSFKQAFRISALQSDKSYVVSVRSFPINVEIKAVKTYTRSAIFGLQGGAAATPGGNITLELNSSLVVLPKVPMQSRYFDPRVGFFTVGYTDYDLNPQGVKSVYMVKRWRLEPKEGDLEKYNRGVLVEPKKPIVFYIDPATPRKWIPYLLQGINDWQTAFEKAGFKNAVVGKMAPTWQEDSSWSLDDARNSAIVYKPSDISNASGPSIADPRSGEIMESHINWYHNVMELLRDWYFIQAGPVDASARKMVFDDELMGQLIRFVSSHEVGHTLGLRHNYGSSSSVPVENLRNKAWVEANGHTPSIMDYARFNYVAQPEDNIGQAGLFPRIGDYDKWAIEWGYRILPQYSGPEGEKAALNKWVMEKMKDKRLWFGTEINPDDPRSQREQVGDDAMKGSMYGIRNLKRIVPNLMEWTRQPNEDYSSLSHMYTKVVDQFNIYMGHVAKYVAGVMETPKMIEEQGAVYEIVPATQQKEAVDFLTTNLFVTPTWLINPEINARTGQGSLSIIGGVQDNILSRLLGTRSLNKLVEAEAALGPKAYQVTELLSDLKKGIWTELGQRKPIDIYRRNLQKSYVNMLINILHPPAAGSLSGGLVITIGGISMGDKSDVKSVVLAHLATLRGETNAAALAIPDPMTRYHLQDVTKRIDNALNPKD
ncbi:MAG: zinc-dependent metalloprotease [Chitinophagaceae bacterium]|nr:zinc-dependent metalloprotease [Chitinophagaceae bacterium]